MSNLPSRHRALLALLAIVPAPTVGILASLFLDQGLVGKLVWAGCKVWLFGLPLLWHVVVDRQRIALPRVRRDGLVFGAMLGLAISVLIIGAYLLVGRHWIDAAFVRQKAAEVGLDNLLLYVVACVYWVTINSLLEEYVFRWFIFRQCEGLLRRGGPAVLLSAACFTVHHVFALAAWFDWRINLVASLGIFIGGALWSWCYLRYRSIWSPYISHAIVDVAVFALGWYLIFM